MVKKNRLKTLTVIMLLLIPVSSFAGGNGGDDVLHFGLSAVFGAGSETYLHHNTSLSTTEKIIAGTAIGSIPGLMKEIYDENQEDNYFSSSDMIANVAGSFVGTVIAAYVNNKLMVNVSKQGEKTKISILYKF
jgi:uncharacterized protein YfiM (DUF2279 family)